MNLQVLEFPLIFAGRIALLEGGFHPCPNVREFAAADLDQLPHYAPEALVCPLNLALFLADQKQRGLIGLPSLSVAMVVLTRLDDAPLATHHRDLLWHAFGVPVFEQVLGWDGTVIARECEVHDGLHIAESAAILHVYDDELLVTQLTVFDEPLVRVRTGLAAEIVTGHCECGSETLRLRNLMPMAQKAASATGGH
jgi:phenylacetate-coenzyme A ligase PaaK-like adenylate-forming protein